MIVKQALLPFSGSLFSVDCVVEKKEREDKVLFQVTGPNQLLEHPPRNSKEPQFHERLWEYTCFEFFLFSDQLYAEWNISLAGDWACFLFASYREKLTNIQNTPPRILRSKIDDGKILFDVVFPHFHSHNFSAKTTQVAGPTAVLRTKEQTSYFAVRHTKEKPDFHCKDNFTWQNRL